MYKNGKFIGVSEEEAMRIPWPEVPIPPQLTDEQMASATWWLRDEPPRPMTLDAQVKSENCAPLLASGVQG